VSHYAIRWKQQWCIKLSVGSVKASWNRSALSLRRNCGYESIRRNLAGRLSKTDGPETEISLSQKTSLYCYLHQEVLRSVMFVCLLVCLLVSSFVNMRPGESDLSKNPIFLKFGMECLASKLTPNVTVNFWEMKVKVQVQNSSIKLFHLHSLAVVKTFTKFGNPTEVISRDLRMGPLAVCFRIESSNPPLATSLMWRVSVRAGK